MSRIFFQPSLEAIKGPIPTSADNPALTSVTVNYKADGGFKTYDDQAQDMINSLVKEYNAKPGRPVVMLFSGNEDQYTSLREGFNTTVGFANRDIGANWGSDPTGQSAVAKKVLEKLSESANPQEIALFAQLKLVPIPTLSGLPHGRLSAGGNVISNFFSTFRRQVMTRNAASLATIDQVQKDLMAAAGIKHEDGHMVKSSEPKATIVGYCNEDTDASRYVTQVGGGYGDNVPGVHYIQDTMNTFMRSLASVAGFKKADPTVEAGLQTLGAGVSAG